MRRFTHRDQRGLTLVELMVAMFIAAVVTAGMVTWMIAVVRADRAQEARLEVIDALRAAKSRIVKEVRFATEIYPPGSGDDSFSFWVDEDRSGGAPDVGELVTYEILGDGTLQRSTDDSSDPAAMVARGVIAADSEFAVADNTLTLTLAIDLDPSDSVKARSVQTTVEARNSQ